MGQMAGFRCPSWVPTSGQENSIDHCLNVCPHQCASPLLLNAIWEAEHANHHVGSYLSASMLTGQLCARQTVYERKYPFFETPLRRYWPFRGTICHAIVETADTGGRLRKSGWLQEMRMAVPIEFPGHPAPVFDEVTGLFTGTFDPGSNLIVTLGGTTDAYNPLRRELHDFKSMADDKIEAMAQGKLKPEWAIQLNIYRWLVAHTQVPEELKAELPELADLEFFPPPEKLLIQGIGMMSFPRTGAAIDVQVHKEGSKWKRWERFDVPELPVMPLADIEALIRREALQWYKWLVLDEPTPVASETNKFVCKSCPFNGDLLPGGRCRPERERYGS